MSRRDKTLSSVNVLSDELFDFLKNVPLIIFVERPIKPLEKYSPLSVKL